MFMMIKKLYLCYLHFFIIKKETGDGRRISAFHSSEASLTQVIPTGRKECQYQDHGHVQLYLFFLAWRWYLLTLFIINFCPKVLLATFDSVLLWYFFYSQNLIKKSETFTQQSTRGIPSFPLDCLARTRFLQRLKHSPLTEI